MNKSYSKIRHIQETNSRLEKRFLNEQFKDDMMTMKSKPSSTEDSEDPFLEILKKTPRDTKREQIQEIIDNFESINCDEFSAMPDDFFEIPEYVSIYCEFYNGKTKDEMFEILNSI